MSDAVRIPDGYRQLHEGETVEDGDYYLSTTGRWVEAPTVGTTLEANHAAPHIRPVSSGAGRPAPAHSSDGSTGAVSLDLG